MISEIATFSNMIKKKNIFIFNKAEGMVYIVKEKK